MVNQKREVTRIISECRHLTGLIKAKNTTEALESKTRSIIAQLERLKNSL